MVIAILQNFPRDFAPQRRNLHIEFIENASNAHWEVYLAQAVTVGISFRYAASPDRGHWLVRFSNESNRSYVNLSSVFALHKIRRGLYLPTCWWYAEL